ncbi:syntaxin-4-like [Pelobates fuscus]|uniref:syntaxin-4-like n=1 Tax=Pelobates fuscus TaxID=191477 RepID=UPI002FE4CBA7
MRDRTTELGNNDSGSENEESRGFLNSAANGSKEGDDKNAQLLETTQDIRNSLQLLEEKVKQLEASQVKILTMPLPEDDMKRDLENLRGEIKRLAKDIRAKLQKIEVTEDEELVMTNVHIRMRRTQHGVLSKKFIELINRCNIAQTEYKERNVKRIKRQLQITGHSVTDEKFDEMLESGQINVFTCNILQDTQAAKQALNEIEARHEEILKLEKSIVELHEMFTFLAMEVEAQGETIDNIEKNILHSKDYVESAQKQLTKAVENKHKARKKKVYIAICVSVLLLVIILIIIVTLFT